MSHSKLSVLHGEEWIRHIHPRVWREEGTRIVAAVSEGQIGTMLDLAAKIGEPLLILWVLRIPRTGVQAARYQSPPLFFEEVKDMLTKYRELFEQDGRSDVWIHAEGATIVLDQHDLLYLYGPLDAFKEALHDFSEGRAAIPSPHAHEYHAAFDDLERAMASELEWLISDLRPEDET